MKPRPQKVLQMVGMKSSTLFTSILIVTRRTAPKFITSSGLVKANAKQPFFATTKRTAYVQTCIWKGLSITVAEQRFLNQLAKMRKSIYSIWDTRTAWGLKFGSLTLHSSKPNATFGVWTKPKPMWSNLLQFRNFSMLSPMDPWSTSQALSSSVTCMEVLILPPCNQGPSMDWMRQILDVKTGPGCVSKWSILGMDLTRNVKQTSSVPANPTPYAKETFWCCSTLREVCINLKLCAV